MLRLRQGLLGLCAKNRAFSTFHRRKRKFAANNCDHNDFSIIGVICKLLKMRCVLIWVNKPAIFVVIWLFAACEFANITQGSRLPVKIGRLAKAYGIARTKITPDHKLVACV
ncbi:hypothetical protein COO20_03650 [Thalassospira marina]|uniref:Uncharacterized protein n=1 Tax=Thalassospira marina TaxID=2048283 RepID=A0A2N3KXK2_9PROT|nr:hypothetical protein COO20_03650 [Thalassospira marina]